jgi:uncharacterized protein RhaS with RHS repeats
MRELIRNVTYTYDQRGNLTHDSVTTYTYDGAGHMVRAQSVTLTLVYTYNTDGLRVAQDVSGTTLSCGTGPPPCRSLS